MTPENFQEAFRIQREKFASLHKESVEESAKSGYQDLLSEPCTPSVALTFAEMFSVCPTTEGEVSHIRRNPAGARAFLLVADRGGHAIEKNSDALSKRIVEKPTEFYVLSSSVLDYLSALKAQGKMFWE
jgi:hypothetical protein